MRLVLALAAIMVLVHGANIALDGQLNNLGILPRHLSGLWGIIISPWIHVDINHLVSNLSAFIVLAWLCRLRSKRYFIIASMFIILLSGLFVWLFGRTAYHIGASGWIFGLWALLMANALFERTIKNILIGFLVFIVYGGLIWGILPHSRVSFEGHIAGIVAGVSFAWLMGHNNCLRALALKQKKI